MIIEYLTSNHKEKWTFSEVVDKKIQINTSIWQIKKMAGKLKQIASLLTGIPIEKFEDQEFKKTELGPEWNNMTVREFLQKLGTDAMRNGLHEHVWANAFWSDYKEHIGYREGNYFNKCGVCGNQFTGDKRAVRCEKCSIFYPNWIITDVRFPNEAQSVKERDGLMIRVNRAPEKVQISHLGLFHRQKDGSYKRIDGKMIAQDTYFKSWSELKKRFNPAGFEMVIGEHPSETGLDDYNGFDYVVENDSTIEELIEKVREILIKEKII